MARANKIKSPFLPLLPLLLVTILFLLTTCDKIGSKEYDYNPNRNIAIDHVRTENIFKDVFNLIFRSLSDSVLLKTGTNVIDGASVRLDTLPEVTLIIDYGWGTICQESQRCRAGKITTILSGSFFNEGTIADISFDTLFAQSEILYPDVGFMLFKIGAEKNMIINLGRDNDNRMVFENNIENATVTDSIPRTFTMNSSKTFIWTSGTSTTWNTDDDVFEISGNSSGVSSDGVTVETEIVDPLLNRFNCHWIVSGTYQFNTPTIEFKNGIVDFIITDGCNNKVNFIYDDVVMYDAMK